DGAGGDEGVTPNRQAAHDSRIGANAGPFADNGVFVQVAAHDLAARVDDVRQDARGSEENVVLDDGAGVERDVILNLDVVANHDMARHQDILAQAASVADLGVGHDMAKVPDLRPVADFAWIIDVRRRMNVVAGFHEDLTSVSVWNG